jgi:hypothetical protein
MKKIYFITVLCLVAAAGPLHADEGMWLLPLIEKLNYPAMQRLGLQISAEDIYSINNSSLKDAVVIFGGGCTGEIISPEGLLLTNHHCGYGTIQQHSSVEHDYLKDGFWAMSRDQEIPTPGLRVTFLDYIEDVSDRILPELAAITDEGDRAKRAGELMHSLSTAAAEGDVPGRRAVVYPMYNNSAYYLFVYKVYEDVRLVGAPPSSIGKFGADTDNWMWPRHTGDFSLFRVYTDKNGNPASYAADNIPLRPKRHLNISLAGVEEGDYAMIMGYPGSTNRYMTSWEVEQMMNVANEIRIHVRGIRQDILLEDMLADPKIKIQYASKYSSSSNYWKNSIGMNRGLKRLNVIAKKEALEQRFAAFAAQSNQEGYKTALHDIRQAIAGRAQDYATQQYYAEVFRGVEINTIAGRATAYLQVLKDKDHSDEALEKAKNALLLTAESFYKDYHAPTDLKVTKALLKVFANKVYRHSWPTAMREADKQHTGDFNKYVDRLFDKSIFASYDRLKAFLDKPSASQLEKDPALQLALSVRSQMTDISTRLSPYNRQLDKGRRYFMTGLMEMDSHKSFYPDANFSTRLTYGNVLSYTPSDGVQYNYFTTLTGVMEKEDPENWEFVVPEKLKELYLNSDFGPYAMEDGRMPVCFLSNNDITGGNSGSPVLNARGELIGCAFDGNWEAMSGDIAFEPELQRCINLDIRYVLFIIDKYAGATHLINEMTLVGKP